MTDSARTETSDVDLTFSSVEVVALAHLLHRAHRAVVEAAGETPSKADVPIELIVQITAAGQALETRLSDAGIEYEPPVDHQPFFYFEL